jgi:gluconolactonase
MIQSISRRSLIKTASTAIGAALAAPKALFGQAAQTGTTPSVITNPPRDFGAGGEPVSFYPDPDVISNSPAFDALVPPNANIRRVFTGAFWCEGVAWSNQGRYLIWCDTSEDRIYRMVEDGHVDVFRRPSNYTNGNTYDYQGRQISAEHLFRRVVRYEHDGTITLIADSFEGKRLNSPNDVVAHRDGSIWFTDPPYGGSIFQGQPDEAGGPTNAAGLLQPKVGEPLGAGGLKRSLPNSIYRVDANLKIERVIGEDMVPDPNGLAFSPDYKKLYVMSTRRGPGDPASLPEKLEAYVFDVGDNNKVSNQKVFCDYKVDGIVCRGDGVRCDAAGNVWISSNAGRALGYSGVTCWSPQGQFLGRIRLPEVCASLAFGGPKRNRLFLGATQSIYAIYLNTQGAGPA